MPPDEIMRFRRWAEGLPAGPPTESDAALLRRVFRGADGFGEEVLCDVFATVLTARIMTEHFKVGVPIEELLVCCYVAVQHLGVWELCDLLAQLPDGLEEARSNHLVELHDKVRDIDARRRFFEVYSQIALVGAALAEDEAGGTRATDAWPRREAFLARLNQARTSYTAALTKPLFDWMLAADDERLDAPSVDSVTEATLAREGIQVVAHLVGVGTPARHQT